MSRLSHASGTSLKQHINSVLHSMNNNYSYIARLFEQERQTHEIIAQTLMGRAITLDADENKGQVPGRAAI